VKPFEYVSVKSPADASRALGTERDQAKILAGGTDLLGEMKDYIVSPSRLVNIKTVPGLDKIEWDEKKGLRIGALVTLARLLEDKNVRARYAVLTDAIALSAMPQIRNTATIGGNLCQRPRCWYYRDEHVLCLKKGGAKCYAVEGENQYHAILGGGPCYIVHPSDPAPALVALGARVVISGGGAAAGKSREVPLEEFFVLPAQNVRRENILAQDEMITHVLVPPPAAGTKSAYVKERERDSYDWALASAAVVVTPDAAGTVKAARIVLGGVAPVPWRAAAAEKAIVGQRLTPAALDRAARAALAEARPLEKNAYKVPLAEAVLRRGLALTMA
jgi:xanthine dehydrogenase YagS FAD-binding subunit